MTNTTTTENAKPCETCAKFHSYGQDHSLLTHVLVHRRMIAAGLRTVLAAGDTARFLRAVEKANKLTDCGLTELFAAALTMHYGPTGLHISRCNADETPSAETLAKFPEVAQRMERAKAKAAREIDAFERNVESDFGFLFHPQKYTGIPVFDR